MCPRFARIFLTLLIRGRREYRVHAAPAVSCATVHKRKRTRAYRFSGGNPAFPAQWFYGLFRALLGDRAFLPPSPADHSASLTPASGRQDHTTSPSASAQFVKSAISVHRIPPHVCDDRETPLRQGRDDSRYRFDLGQARSGIFLQRGLDTRIEKLPVGQITGWDRSICMLRRPGIGRDGRGSFPICRSRRIMSAVRAKAEITLRRQDFD